MKKLIINFIFLINLLVIFLFWWSGSESLIESRETSLVLIALGRITGLLAEYLLLLQLVLIGRITWIEQEYGHDKLNTLHRGIGYFLSVFILIHPLLLTFGYSISNNVSLLAQFRDFLSNWHYVFLAIVGLLLFIIAAALSFPSVRKKIKYETWYFTHLLMYVFIGLIFTHQIQTADVSSGAAFYYWAILNFVVFGVMLMFRFGRPYVRFLEHRFYVSKVIEETPSTYSIYISGRNIQNFKFKPGQHANFTFLAKGRWFTHPFSFSALSIDESLRITVKKSGDFTDQIGSMKSGTKVIIDGPLGLFIEGVATKDKFLFIAGGVGITPIRAMMESLSRKNMDSILLYSNRNSKDVIFKDEIEKLNTKTYIIYSEEQMKGFEHGFIDAEKMKRLVPDILDREVYVCGPPPMMAVMVKLAKSLGVSNQNIHIEKFS